MAQLTDEQLEELKGKYPTGKLFTIGDQDFVVKPASQGDWLKYRTMQNDYTDPAKRAGAVPFLVHACLAYPPREEMAKLVLAKPGIMDSIHPECRKVSGAEADVIAGEF